MGAAETPEGKMSLISECMLISSDFGKFVNILKLSVSGNIHMFGIDWFYNESNFTSVEYHFSFVILLNVMLSILIFTM